MPLDVQDKPSPETLRNLSTWIATNGCETRRRGESPSEDDIQVGLLGVRALETTWSVGLTLRKECAVTADGSFVEATIDGKLVPMMSIWEQTGKNTERSGHYNAATGEELEHQSALPISRAINLTELYAVPSNLRDDEVLEILQACEEQGAGLLEVIESKIRRIHEWHVRNGEKRRIESINRGGGSDYLRQILGIQS